MAPGAGHQPLLQPLGRSLKCAPTDVFFPCRKNVAGKIVLVTGSANGIGREIVLNFAPLGAILVLWDIDEEGNKETAELAKKSGAQAVYTYRCDVSNREEVYAVAKQVQKEIGDVNILIDDAGIMNGKNFIDLTDAEMEKTLEVNAMAHFWAFRTFLPSMVTKNDGHLVIIASLVALFGHNKASDYAASKAAALGFFESASFELWAAKKKGVNTTIILPYIVDTKLTKGLKTVRPFLVPILDVKYVGKKIVDAILKEKLYLILPHFGYIIPLRLFLPRKAVFALMKYLGIFNVADNY
uniref:Uncharacterized protein n=1 Tax=Salvator merianae TaxID=96440 RepID=A0A8D0DUX9_SALMN